MAPKQKSSPQSFDVKAAYREVLWYDLVNIISHLRIVLCKCFSCEISSVSYVTEKVRKYFELRGIQCGVSPTMLLGPLLVGSSNLMGRSQVII